MTFTIRYPTILIWTVALSVFVLAGTGMNDCQAQQPARAFKPAIPKTWDDAVDGLAFSLDGNTLATASRDKTVRLWRALPFTETDGECISTQRNNK